ncbi:MAG: sulfur oxidation c-type cytochrome SoxX [Chromatiaceae bacterium]|nr:sulfur oxidation c-type cytochrome SoxX [Chromatiaceae bacterium]
MISRARSITAAAIISLAPILSLAAAQATEADVAAGREIALDRAQGNCIACHLIEGGESPGNIGPPLVAMKARYPDSEQLRKQIWDPTAANPNSAMPPFGKHEILTDEQIGQVVAFILTL